MKFENTQVWGFEHALRGMRNAKNSWDKADSQYCYSTDYDCNECSTNKNCPLGMTPDNSGFVIGPNDMKLAQALIKAGSEHRKFMRQIFVSVDITAPLYFFKEFDTYKVGTVANSTSTMHKMASKPITLDCFEIDDFNKDLKVYDNEPYNIDSTIDDCVESIIDMCETLRQRYLETKDKRYWKELIRWLPESWLQTRTVTMNYENLLGMCSKGQRRFHKLTEWSDSFISWARSLPYSSELIFIDELDN